MDRDRSSYSRTFFIGASRGAATWGWLLAGSLRLRLPGLPGSHRQWSARARRGPNGP
jgi:hypothetical protein